MSQNREPLGSESDPTGKQREERKPQSRRAFLTLLTERADRNNAFGDGDVCSTPFSEALITLKIPSHCFPVGSYSDPYTARQNSIAEIMALTSFKSPATFYKYVVNAERQE